MSRLFRPIIVVTVLEWLAQREILITILLLLIQIFSDISLCLSSKVAGGTQKNSRGALFRAPSIYTFARLNFEYRDPSTLNSQCSVYGRRRRSRIVNGGANAFPFTQRAVIILFRTAKVCAGRKSGKRRAARFRTSKLLIIRPHGRTCVESGKSIGIEPNKSSQRPRYRLLNYFEYYSNWDLRRPRED